MTLVLWILGVYLAGASITYATIALALLPEPARPKEPEARAEAGASPSAMTSVQA